MKKAIRDYFYTYVKPIAPNLSLHYYKYNRRYYIWMEDKKVFDQLTPAEVVKWMQGFVACHNYKEGKL